jgi:inorganic pyrophosphatase
MSDITALGNKWDAKTRECRAIIETPKGRRSKFDYSPELGLFELGGLLPEGTAFPFDFGFVPSTLADDGDPIDVMVLMDEPAHVGCALDVRIIGAIEADQYQDGKKTIRWRLFL